LRTCKEIKEQIISFAVSDKRIRAVLLNGSRANPKLNEDPYQDYDIIFIVEEMNTFILDHSWTDIFGKKLIWQLPDEMVFGRDEQKVSFTYLMLFEDGNRIDLSLFPVDKLKDHYKKDSLTLVWLDKDELFAGIQDPADQDYLIKKPSEKEFLDTCNEFWWVSTYVAKGILRDEIVYAKEMMELPVRKMFLKIISWYIGIQTNFSVSFGKSGRFIDKHISSKEYNRILKTYPDHHKEHIKSSLFLMIEIFGSYAKQIAEELKFNYQINEEKNTTVYLKEILSDKGKKQI